VKAFILIKVEAGIIKAGKAKGVGDNNSNNITINSSLKRIRFKELITYIRVSYV